MGVQLVAEVESWPLANTFRISREAKTEANVIVVTLTDGNVTGRGECVPYARYGESVASVVDQIESIRQQLKHGINRNELNNTMTAGAARNAIDCAMWDLEIKKQTAAISILNSRNLNPLTTAYTLSLDEPKLMEQSAIKASERPIIKVKLGGDGDDERIFAVRQGAPSSTLIVDANESWNEKNLERNLRACELADVKLIEQPFKADDDEILTELNSKILICADESVHTNDDIIPLKQKYQAINIKLDKAGGLTEALKMLKTAEEADMKVMVGCMVATSLAMAPATILAQNADFVDLDGPLLLKQDRKHGIQFEGSQMLPYYSELWG